MKPSLVIMAAGMGRRMKEVTENNHKALLEVNGKPIIEYNIECIIEAGIDRIILVVGYLKERFYYLKDKYGDQIEIIFVENKKYKEYNTLSTLYYASPYFTMDSYIVCADLYMVNNIYKKYETDHNFYLHRHVENLEKPEWIAELTDDNCIIKVDTAGCTGSAYTGVSYWPLEDIQYIKELIFAADWESEETKKMYWDEILFPVFSTWKVHVKQCTDKDFVEVDDQEDLGFLYDFVDKK